MKWYSVGGFYYRRAGFYVRVELIICLPESAVIAVLPNISGIARVIDISEILTLRGEL